MLREMTGQEVQDWVALYSTEEDTNREHRLDAKGKAALRAHR